MFRNSISNKPQSNGKEIKSIKFKSISSDFDVELCGSTDFMKT